MGNRETKATGGRFETLERRRHLDATLGDVGSPTESESETVIELPYETGEIVDPGTEVLEELVFWTTVVEDSGEVDGGEVYVTEELVVDAVAEGEELGSNPEDWLFVVDPLPYERVTFDEEPLVDPAVCYIAGEVSEVDETLVDPAVCFPTGMGPVFSETPIEDVPLIDPAVCYTADSEPVADDAVLGITALETPAEPAAQSPEPTADTPVAPPAASAPATYSPSVLEDLELDSTSDDVLA